MSHSFQAAKVAVVEGRDVFQKLKPNAQATTHMTIAGSLQSDKGPFIAFLSSIKKDGGV